MNPLENGESGIIVEKEKKKGLNEKGYLQVKMSFICAMSSIPFYYPFSHAVKHQPQRNPNYNFAFGVLAAL